MPWQQHFGVEPLECGQGRQCARSVRWASTEAGSQTGEQSLHVLVRPDHEAQEAAAAAELVAAVADEHIVFSEQLLAYGDAANFVWRLHQEEVGLGEEDHEAGQAREGK
jgi:hypothetical protein